ncbi:MAG: dephospho-CoA kinase [Bdellovibrionota bacterium]
MNLKKEWNKLRPEKRLHSLSVPVIGLTGGIATGKSTVAKILIEKGFPVINADLLVKDIYVRSDTKNFISTNYPDVMKGTEIDFKLLREKFFTAPVVKDEIEAFIYARMKEAFDIAYEKLGRPAMVIYDVPLLFEKHLESVVDMKVLVYAPAKIQRARLMARDGHEEDMARTIMDSQMNIEEKKNKADFIIDNSATLVELAEEVNQFLRQIQD